VNKMLEKLRAAAEKDWSLLAAGLFGLGATACPCPTCIGGTLAFFLNWVREKIPKCL